MQIKHPTVSGWPEDSQQIATQPTEQAQRRLIGSLEPAAFDTSEEGIIKADR